jgi:hypothetical protein
MAGLGRTATVVRGVDPVSERSAFVFSVWESSLRNDRRLLRPIGDIPPAEKELVYFRQRGELATRRDSKQKMVSWETGAIHRCKHRG